MPEAPASYFATGLVAPNQPDVTGRRGDFYTTRVGSERAHALLRQPRHGSRAWYCPVTLASGSDPRHESRVALLGRALGLRGHRRSRHGASPQGKTPSLLPSTSASVAAPSASMVVASRHEGHIPRATSLSRCWLYLSSAPLCEMESVSSHASSSKSTPIANAWFIFSWHLVAYL